MASLGQLVTYVEGATLSVKSTCKSLYKNAPLPKGVRNIVEKIRVRVGHNNGSNFRRVLETFLGTEGEREMKSNKFRLRDLKPQRKVDK